MKAFVLVFPFWQKLKQTELFELRKRLAMDQSYYNIRFEVDVSLMEQFLFTVFIRERTKNRIYIMEMCGQEK